MLQLHPAAQAELLVRLLVAVALGGVLGLERQLGQHPAGLRTHILVSLGAAAYTVAGTYGVAGSGTVQDAGRIAAQIVAGVGFLGAGTIWRGGSDRVIYGLTTAASIWVAASIGMLAGFGLYVMAAGCAVLGFVVLRLMKGLEDAPARVRVPRLRFRRRAARTSIGAAVAAAEAEQNAAIVALSPAGVPESDTDGILGAPDLPKRRKRGKKRQKRKRRDAEREGLVQISDAPPGGGQTRE
jgi:putative Mg2+ transporter-C (MgtC) family protein